MIHMQLENATRQKIIRDILVSLFIYALPVLLMFLSFYVKGSRPWQKQTQKNSIHILNH
jgi:preprotein translocase subunit YajC